MHPGSEEAPAYVSSDAAPPAFDLQTARTVLIPNPAYASAAERPITTFRTSSLRPGTRYTWTFHLTNFHGGAPIATGEFVTPSN